MTDPGNPLVRSKPLLPDAYIDALSSNLPGLYLPSPSIENTLSSFHQFRWLLVFAVLVLASCGTDRGPRVAGQSDESPNSEGASEKTPQESAVTSEGTTDERDALENRQPVTGENYEAAVDEVQETTAGENGDTVAEQTKKTTSEENTEQAHATSITLSTNLDYTDFGSLRIGDQVVEAVKQAAAKRTFQEASTELIQTIGRPAGDEADSAQVLYAVTILRLHPDESHVFAFDQSRRQIRRFRLSDGKFDQAYGTPGRGEGELASVTDFDVAPDGSVWVLDTAMRRVTVFEADATLRRSNSFDMTAHSLALLPGDGVQQRYAILSGVNTSDIFHVYSAMGDSLASFGTFGKKSIMNLGMLGALTQTSRGFALVPWYAGRIAAFDSESKLDFFRSTFYPTPPPRLGAAGSGQTLEEIEGPVRSRAPVVMHVTDDLMFVAAYQRDSAPTMIDAYDVRSGDYRYSIGTPDSAGGCVVWGVTDSSVFTICPAVGTIKQWKRGR